jgi:hypothetical protein
LLDKEKEKHNGDEEMKDGDEVGATVIKQADNIIDNYIGKYGNEDEMRIGDRSIDELIEI